MAVLKNLVTTTKHLIDTIQLSEKEDTLKFLDELNVILEDHSEANSTRRGYLGMSGIGDPCRRKLWYNFHFASQGQPHEERTKRIFNTGHIAEAFIIKDLRKIDYEIENAQAECSSIFGHFEGHIDGEVLGVIEAPKTKHLLEMKTHNDKSFKELVKNQVQKSKPVHYAQMQIYMKHRNLTRALYVAYNKNDSQYYFERVYFDKDFAEDLERKAQDIIMSEEPPKKEFPPTWYACKWCNHNDVCHHGREPVKNCRTCENCDIEQDGKWSCTYHDKTLTVEEQILGCTDYKIGWGLDGQ